MAFSFGQTGGTFGSAAPATPTPFGGGSTFGAASTPAFGASSSAFSFAAASTPAFGAAASTPAFGAQAASPLFGASSTPAFGATSTPGFGASTPSLFGASSTSLFGASSTPAFGASSTPGATFGAATGGLFGAPAAAPAAGGAFNFNTGGSSLFGGAPAQTNTFGLTTQMAPASYSAPPATDPAVKELAEIAAAYDPSKPQFRFTALLLNVVENPAQRVKPAGVDELRWRQAMKEAGGENNPHKLWPVVAQGFKDLAARSAEQERALAENKQRVESLRAVGHQLARRQEDALRERVVGLQRQHEQLAHRLLRVWRHLDGLESQLGTMLGYRRDPAKEREISDRLRALEAEVAPMSATGLQRRLEALAAAARLSAGAGGLPGEGGELSTESQARLFSVLKDHAEAIQRLQDVLAADAADLEVLRAEAGGDDAPGLVAVVPAGRR